MQKKLLFVVVFCCAAVGSVRAVYEDDIFTAAQNNDVALAEQCIEEYGKKIFNERTPSSFDYKRSTPLHVAAGYRSAEVAEFFLKEGGIELLEKKDSRGQTPLLVATLRWPYPRWFVEKVEKWDSSFVELFKIRDKNGATPLQGIATCASQEFVKLFLKNELCVAELLRLKDNWGNIPLCNAIGSNERNEVIAELFLNKGGKDLLWERDKRGDTPLHNAACRSAIEIVRLFIQNGANIQAKNDKDNIPYDVTISDAMRELLRNTQHANDSLLAGVIEEDREKVVVALDGGAQINVQDDAGQTALHRAVRKNNPILVRGLLSRGADLRIYDKYGKLPIDYVWCTGEKRGKNGNPMSYELLSIFLQAAGDNNKGNLIK